VQGWKKQYGIWSHRLKETSQSFLQIKESIKANTNIFSLAQQIVHSTPCRVTVQLCARVALMVCSASYLMWLAEWS
jgi:hypothetical protein